MIPFIYYKLRLERSVFSKKFRKIFDLSKEYLFVSKFLWEVPKFKEKVLICVITVIKVRDLLLTLLQVITILAA